MFGIEVGDEVGNMDGIRVVGVNVVGEDVGDTVGPKNGFVVGKDVGITVGITIGN